MKKTFILLLFFLNISFSQKSNRDSEIAFKANVYNKILSGNYNPTENQLKYDVKYYSLNLNLNPSNRWVEGYVKINSIALAGIDKVELNLTDGLEVDSVFHESHNTSYRYNNNILTVNLHTICSKNSEIRITIYYHGSPSSSGFGSFGVSTANNKSMIWTLSEPFGARDWWPCKDHMNDKADSADINITVPQEMVVASNGNLRNVIEAGGKKTYYWHEGYPISTYLMSVTAYEYNTFSNYYKYSDTDSMEIKFFTVYDKNSPRYDNYIFLPNMIKIFSELFGEYPFIKEKYGQAEFPWGGGMEHQTCTSLGSFGEFIIVHELAHQWWGDMITCGNFQHIWLNEGFATYSEALYAEKAYGKEKYTSEMANTKFLGNGTIYVNDLSNTYRIFDNNLTYNKASWVLHMLRRVTGDEVFFKILKEYYKSSFQYKTITTEEFQKVCESVYGKELSWFFNEWIYQEYYPQYSFSYSTSVNENQTNIKLDISQLQTNYIYKMPIDINISTSSGDTTIVIIDSLKNQSFSLIVNGIVKSVQMDKDEWILRTIEQTPAGVTSIPSIDSYELFQNYPNPFNPSTEISFYLPKSEYVSLKVYDILGRELTTLCSEILKSGNHKINFNSSQIPGGLTSGIYFYKLASKSFSDVKKMMIVK